MLRLRLIGLVAIVAAAVPAGAAEPIAADLPSLLSIAMRENPRIQAAEAAYRAAREDIRPAGALPDPTLSITSQGTPIDDPSPANAATTKLGVMQMIPFPGKRGRMEAMSSAEAAMEAAMVDQSRFEVAAELTRAHADLELLHTSIDIVEEELSALGDMSEAARAKYRVGQAPQQDLLKAGVEASLQTNQIASLTLQIPAAESRIRALLGRPQDMPLARPVPADTLWGEVGLAGLEQRGLSGHPALVRARRAVERQEAALALARKNGLPDFTVGAEYMAERRMDDRWSGMLGITLPVWRGSKVAPERRSAEQSLLQARQEEADLRNTVAAGIREAWARAQAARTQLRIFRDSVLPLAEQSLAAARSAYVNDRGDFLDVLDAERSWLQTRLEFARARAEYLRSRADLGLAAGDATLLGIQGESHHE